MTDLTSNPVADALRAALERARVDKARHTYFLKPSEIDSIVAEVCAAAQPHETTGAHPRELTGHAAALLKIEAAVREIEIICDEHGFDPVQWLIPEGDDDVAPECPHDFVLHPGSGIPVCRNCGRSETTRTNQVSTTGE